jgi:hypothetical protein
MRITKSTILFVLVSGGCLGWLTGLSLSPAVHVVIGATVGLVGTIVSALSGVVVKNPEKEELGKPPTLASSDLKISPIPIAVFMLGLALAAPLGILARTHEWFSQPLEKRVEAWEKLGITKDDITKHLFENAYPISSGTSQAKTPETTPPKGPEGGLYSLTITERGALRTLSLGSLREFMRSSSNPLLKLLAADISDDSTLQRAARDLADAS